MSLPFYIVEIRCCRARIASRGGSRLTGPASGSSGGGCALAVVCHGGVPRCAGHHRPARCGTPSQVCTAAPRPTCLDSASTPSIGQLPSPPLPEFGNGIVPPLLVSAAVSERVQQPRSQGSGRIQHVNLDLVSFVHEPLD